MLHSCNSRCYQLIANYLKSNQIAPEPPKRGGASWKSRRYGVPLRSSASTSSSARSSVWPCFVSTCHATAVGLTHQRTHSWRVCATARRLASREVGGHPEVLAGGGRPQRETRPRSRCEGARRGQRARCTPRGSLPCKRLTARSSRRSLICIQR